MLPLLALPYSREYKIVMQELFLTWNNSISVMVVDRSWISLGTDSPICKGFLLVSLSRSIG